MSVERAAARACRAGLVALLALLLAACPAAPRKPAPLPTVAAPADFPAQFYQAGAAALGRVYRIEPTQSQLDIYVHRSGKLAHLGHNHVVSSRELNGFALVARTQSGSRFDFWFPVAGLVVDDPQLRAAAGADFASKPSADDIAGTRGNMLGEKLLDAERHPWILVAGRQKGPGIELQLRVRDGVYTHMTATHFEAGSELLHASGEVELTHADLGLEPFSVFGGALAVDQKLLVRYRITARAQ